MSGKPNPEQFLRVDAKEKVVALTLVAGYDGENNGYNFDGYGRGELTVTVPLGWHVQVKCVNRAGGQHSCDVVAGPMTATPAFAGATSPNPMVGLEPGKTATFSFVAARPGSFRLASLVPGQEEARMWDVLVVARGAKPGISARPGP